MVKVEIHGIEAAIDDYQWTSDDEKLAEILNLMLDPLGPSGADPYPDLTAASEAMERLGGEVVSFDEPDTEVTVR